MLRFRFFGFCILSNIAMIFLTLTFSILMDRVQHTEDEDPTSQDARDVKEFVTKMYFIASAVFFGVLVALAAIYIIKIRHARISTAGISRREVVMTSLIFLIFLSRCIWDFLAAFDEESKLFRLQIRESDDSHLKLMNVVTFISLFIWEVVPTLLVIVYFRRIPSTADSHCIGAWSCCRNRPFFRKCLTSWPWELPEDYFDGEVSTASGTNRISDDEDIDEYVNYHIDGADVNDESVNQPSVDYVDLPEHSGVISSLTNVPRPYHHPRDYDASGHKNSVNSGSGITVLSPGSFVRTNTAHLYGRSYSSSHGNGLHAGSLNHAPPHPLSSFTQPPHGSHLVAQTGHADLYGSPTWLNPNHPALAHLATHGQQQRQQ